MIVTVPEQSLTGQIKVHTHKTDTVFYHPIQGRLQLGLTDVMLDGTTEQNMGHWIYTTFNLHAPGKLYITSQNWGNHIVIPILFKREIPKIICKITRSMNRFIL